MADEKIIIQLAIPERKYAKVYHDFLDNSFLTTEEQMIFIVLKAYVNFREDSGEVYPSMKTICKRAKMSEKRARKNINALIKKGIVKKVQRGLTKTNLYTLSDYSTMWACDNVKDVEAIADNQGMKPLTPAEHIAELERMGYTVQIKEKGLESTEPTKVTVEPSTKQLNQFNISDNITNSAESQYLERYTLDQIKQLFDYDKILIDHVNWQQDIDSVMNILYTTMNTTRATIRIAREDKPAMVVLGKLMKLDKETIIYAIEKFSEQTERIKNPTAYLLTILYNAPEQYYLDKKNQERNQMSKEDHSQEEKKAENKNKESKNSFANFNQRTYDYEELEKELLNQAAKQNLSHKKIDS